MVASLVPRPLPDFMSPPSKKIGSPQLQDKISEWPWDETSHQLRSQTQALVTKNGESEELQ